MSRVVLVCGGRNYDDRATVYDTLDLLHALEPITRLVEGGARGTKRRKSADQLACEWRKMMMIPGKTYEADWNNIDHPTAVIKPRLDGSLYDITAGPRRNREMFFAELPDLVVAFQTPGEKNSGTKHTINLAREAGCEVVIV